MQIIATLLTKNNCVGDLNKKITFAFHFQTITLKHLRAW